MLEVVGIHCKSMYFLLNLGVLENFNVDYIMISFMPERPFCQNRAQLLLYLVLAKADNGVLIYFWFVPMT